MAFTEAVRDTTRGLSALHTRTVPPFQVGMEPLCVRCSADSLRGTAVDCITPGPDLNEPTAVSLWVNEASLETGPTTVTAALGDQFARSVLMDA